MYLQFLKENDKENFLSLAHGVSLLDGALGKLKSLNTKNV